MAKKWAKLRFPGRMSQRVPRLTSPLTPPIPPLPAVSLLCPRRVWTATVRYVILVDQLSLQPDSGSAVSTPEDGPEGAASMKVYSSQGSLLWEGRMDTFPY